MPLSEIKLNIIVATDRNASVALITGPNGEILASGSSKRTPGDPFNSVLGEQLAAARALMNYGEEIYQSCN